MKIGYLMQAGVADMFTRPYSGPANHVHHVCDELRQMGHDVRLLLVLQDQIWKTDDGLNYEPVAVRWLGRGPLRLAERGIRRFQSMLNLPFAGFFDSLRFVQACRQELDGYDLFLERMGWMGYGGALASRLMGIPLVLEVNGDHLSELEMLGMKPEGGQLRLSLAVTGYAARRAAHVVATGEGWRQRFIERWAVPSQRVSVVENGSELVNLLTRESLPAFQESVPTAGIVVAYVGGFEPWHGLNVLLQALAAARQKGADLRLLMIGDGPERENLERLIAELALAPFVEMTGHKTPADFADYLLQAEIGVSPYCGRVEFSGLKLLDYKAAGLATIASGEKGQPEVISDGQTGRIVKPCCVEGLRDALIELAQDHTTRRQMGRQARLEAEELHSWRHTVEQLLGIFAGETAK